MLIRKQNIPGPDAGLVLLLGGAPSDPHETTVLQGHPRPALHWLIACADAGVMVCRKVCEGSWAPAARVESVNVQTKISDCTIEPV